MLDFLVVRHRRAARVFAEDFLHGAALGLRVLAAFFSDQACGRCCEFSSQVIEQPFSEFIGRMSPRTAITIRALLCDSAIQPLPLCTYIFSASAERSWAVSRSLRRPPVTS